jgi:hypothetical protein
MTPLVTVRGSSSLATITQGEASWLDLCDYDSATFFLDVREVTGAVTLTYQTSPSKDDASFQTLVAPILLATSQRADSALARFAFMPIARYVRWQLTSSSSPFDATFTIEVAAH